MAIRNMELNFLCAYLLFLSTTFPAHVSSDINSENVRLSLYYDSLCRHSASFIVKQLATVFENDLISILDLSLIPSANSRFNPSNNTFHCQHGPDECLLNAVEACAINIWHDVNKHYGLIYCIEFLVVEGRQKDWKSCFESLGLPLNPILDCFTNGNGTKFEHQYANETANLMPPHAFVPWVVVNHQPLQLDFYNFASYVCQAYKGSGAPEACRLLAHPKDFYNFASYVCQAYKGSGAPEACRLLAHPKVNSTAVPPVCYRQEK